MLFKIFIMRFPYLCAYEFAKEIHYFLFFLFDLNDFRVILVRDGGISGPKLHQISVSLFFLSEILIFIFSSLYFFSANNILGLELINEPWAGDVYVCLLILLSLSEPVLLFFFFKFISFSLL